MLSRRTRRCLRLPPSFCWPRMALRPKTNRVPYRRSRLRSPANPLAPAEAGRDATDWHMRLIPWGRTRRREANDALVPDLQDRQGAQIRGA